MSEDLQERESARERIGSLTDRELLIRIDTRLESIERKYVTRDEFTPVQRLVYGMVGLVLLAAFGAILKLVIQ